MVLWTLALDSASGWRLAAGGWRLTTGYRAGSRLTADGGRSGGGSNSGGNGYSYGGSDGDCGSRDTQKGRAHPRGRAVGQKAKEELQHLGFPRGPPPQY